MYANTPAEGPIAADLDVSCRLGGGARTDGVFRVVKHLDGNVQLAVDGLREGACECYETVRSQYAKLLGEGAEEAN